MKICVAQTRPVTGDIGKNIDNHLRLIGLGVANEADLIIFPELSLTGYEPTLARGLACRPDDERLDQFQQISKTRKMAIGVGMPTLAQNGIQISMVLFLPDGHRQVYSKKYIHADEEPFFSSGENYNGLQIDGNKVALAICYEISIPAHTESALRAGSGIYLASVAKSVNGMDKALETLSGIARSNAVTAMMSNCVGICDGSQCGGRSSAWNDQGVLIGQLDDRREGMLLLDTVSGEVASATI